MHRHLLSIETDPPANTLLAQALLNTGFVLGELAFCGSGHVHFQLEMNAPTEIEAQLHRRSAALHQPIGRSGRKIQGHNKSIAQLSGDNGLRAELLLAVIESQQGRLALVLNLFTEKADACLLKCVFCTRQHASVNLLRTAGPGDL